MLTNSGSRGQLWGRGLHSGARGGRGHHLGPENPAQAAACRGCTRTMGDGAAHRAGVSVQSSAEAGPARASAGEQTQVSRHR